jgi:hypothetical protein
MSRRFRNDVERYNPETGQTSQFARWMGGDLLSAVLNVPCEDGKKRTAFVQSDQADTYFSIAANVSVYDPRTEQSRWVSGSLYSDSTGYTFGAYHYRKNAYLLVPIEKLRESYDKYPEGFNYNPYDLEVVA